MMCKSETKTVSECQLCVKFTTVRCIYTKQAISTMMLLFEF